MNASLSSKTRKCPLARHDLWTNRNPSPLDFASEPSSSVQHLLSQAWCTAHSQSRCLVHTWERLSLPFLWPLVESRYHLKEKEMVYSKSCLTHNPNALGLKDRMHSFHPATESCRLGQRATLRVSKTSSPDVSRTIWQLELTCSLWLSITRKMAIFKHKEWVKNCQTTLI